MATEPPEVGRHPSLARLFTPVGDGAEADPTDMSDRTWWEGQLDRLAEGVFSGPEGPGRAAPLLARWDAQVGRLGAGDVDYTLLQAARVDWALCDAEAPGGGPGESWAWRAAHGCVAGVEPDAAVQALELLHTALDEADLAAPLNQVVADFPGVEIGSYPRWQPDEHGHLRCVVRLTFEAIGAQRHRAREARDALASALGPTVCCSATAPATRPR